MRHSRTVIQYLREDPKTYAIVAGFGTIVGLLELAGITSLLPAIALLLGEEITHLPRPVADLIAGFNPYYVIATYIGLVLLQAGIAAGAEGYFVHVMARWRTRLSLEYLRNILGAEFAALKDVRPGEAEVTISRNIGYAVRLRHRTAILLTDAILAVFYVTIALLVSRYALALFILLGGVYSLLNQLLLHIRMRHSQIAKDRYIAAAQLIGEHLRDVRGLLAGDREHFLRQVGRELDVAAVSQRKNDQINIAIRLSSQPLILVMVAIGVAFSKLVLQMGNAQILMMLYVFYRAAPRLINLVRGYGEIIQDSPIDILPDVRRWNAFKRRTERAPVASDRLGLVELADVTVVYEGTPILRRVNMTVRQNSLVVLVGRSGSGKSTLLDVVCGFKRPECGSVRVEGLDPSVLEYDAWLRRHVALLRPESVVVSGTIAGNVAFLEELVDETRVRELLEQVGLTDVMDRNGIYMEIAAAGRNLSAGQRQRLLLARALYKRPQLLILDEPTSNLDRRTEDDINKLVASLKNETAMLVVSHRGEILRQADAVYRLTGGTVISEGAASMING